MQRSQAVCLNCALSPCRSADSWPVAGELSPRRFLKLCDMYPLGKFIRSSINGYYCIVSEPLQERSWRPELISSCGAQRPYAAERGLLRIVGRTAMLRSEPSDAPHSTQLVRSFCVKLYRKCGRADLSRARQEAHRRLASPWPGDPIRNRARR